MSAFMNVGVDSATVRLIAAARATQATEGLPKESARRLVAQARGVRLYLEARQDDLARAALTDLDALIGSCDDQRLVAAYGSLTRDVRKVMGWADRLVAKGA